MIGIVFEVFISKIVVVWCSGSVSSQSLSSLIPLRRRLIRCYEFRVVIERVGIAAEKVTKSFKFLPRFGKYLGQVGPDEQDKPRVRLIAYPDVMIPQTETVGSLGRQRRFGIWQELVKGLMDDNTAGREKMERGVMDTPRNQHRYTINSNAFLEKWDNQIAMRVKPWPDVLYLDFCPFGLTMAHDEI